jgi:acid phosphatase
MVAVFENENASSILGGSAAPYLNSLARQGAVLTDSHGVAHPSEPNYLALFSGSTHGVTGDPCPVNLSGANLATELMRAGRSFVGYSESLPAAGWTGCDAGEYARRHNPWVDFSSVPPEANQPLSALPGNFAQLPTVSFVVPNVCHDMHDCSIARGDAWARNHLSGFVDWAQSHNSLLVVTFDEDDSDVGPNHIATILVGPMVRPGRDNQNINHYGVLRTIETMYGLPFLGHSASAQPVTGVWR